ncbi:MAG: hypothetical protein WCD70_08180 [Alphaproteobacteria bacterium]
MIKDYLKIFGVLSLIAVVYPGSPIIGLMLFVVPGILLEIAPTVTIYGSIAVALYSNPLFKKYPVFISLLLSVLAGCVISFFLNQTVLEKMRNIHMSDIEIQQPLALPDVIGLMKEFPQMNTPDDRNNSCDLLCQRLLNSGAVKKVLIAPYTLANALDPTPVQALSYSVEQMKSCDAAGSVKNANQDTPVLKNVELIKKNGQCLAQSHAPLSDSGIILVAYSTDEQPRYGWITLGDLRARTIEVLKKDGNDYKVTYRHSLIKGQPFIYPLAVGPILSANAGFDAHFGFYRYDKFINTTGQWGANMLDDFAPQMQQLFGGAIKEPPSSLDKIKAF